MKYLGDAKELDFYFTLALVAILGVTGSLYLQFSNAGIEFDSLNGSMYSSVRSQDSDFRESSLIEIELDQLENDLGELN